MMFENEVYAADETAFNCMVRSHSDTLMRTAMNITRQQQSAEDIVQEAFLRLWQNRNKIVPYNMGGWLHTVTVHLAYKHIKKEKRNSIYAKLNNIQTDWHTDVEDRLLHKEGQYRHDAACMRLPEKQQAVYRLSREQGLSRDEIACKLGISPNTVKNHLLKAVQFMKGHVQTCGLIIVFLVFNNFFIIRSTKPLLKDLYNREEKVNRESQIYKSLIQHGLYFKNSASFPSLQQLLGYTGYKHRD